MSLLKSSTKIGMNIRLGLRSKRRLRAGFGAKANHKRYDQSTISFSAHGYRADASRRARFRHLFAPAQGQYHFHRDSDRRRGGKPRRRANAVSRIGGPGP